ncbi:MAG TPA: hypothetical protein VFH47_08005 [Candidatus Thermoplasmatota archaeon]|nr:hypothetical protein [Candidatus Thermoplasmatota archaeon]
MTPPARGWPVAPHLAPAVPANLTQLLWRTDGSSPFDGTEYTGG